ncbi:MFS transporter [Halomonas cupida]|uniref:MFS transporter n=1 Tax=Halomonas cupida TaxID=44933 RepID=UPI003A8D7289
MHHSRRVIGFINTAHFLDHMFMLLYPTAVLAMTETFQRSYGEMLALATGGFVAFGLGALPSGWLGDRWSRRRMLIVFHIGIGASAVIVGLSTSVWMLATGLTMIGVFASIYHPVGTGLLVSHAERIGRAVGWNGVFGNLGVAFAPLITGGLVQVFGWRAAFLVPGVLVILCGLLFASCVSEEQAVRPGRGRTAAHSIPSGILLRALIGLGVITIAGGLLFNAFTIALPKVLDERLAFLQGNAVWVGLMVSAIFSIGAMAQLLTGRALDRMPIKYCLWPLVLEVPLLGCMAWGHDGVMLLAAAGLTFLIFANVTINDTIVARYSTEEWRSRVYGVRYVLSFGMSGIAVPLVAWSHTTGEGFVTLFLVLAGASLMVPLGTLIFPYRPQEIWSSDSVEPPESMTRVG